MAEPNSSTREATTNSTSTRDAAQAAGGSASASTAARKQETGRSKSGGIVERVKEQATAQLTTQKDRGIDALGSVAQAVRASTQRLRDERHDAIANYVEKAADQIDGWSARLREKDVDALLTDVQRIARQQPAVFIGSAFTLGLIGARFLKSSPSQKTVDQDFESPWSQYGAGTIAGIAHDRSAVADSEDIDVTIDRGEAAFSDIETHVSDDEPTSAARSGGSRARKSTSRRERS